MIINYGGCVGKLQIYWMDLSGGQRKFLPNVIVKPGYGSPWGIRGFGGHGGGDATVKLGFAKHVYRGGSNGSCGSSGRDGTDGDCRRTHIEEVE